jgi:hypothetical protein
VVQQRRDEAQFAAPRQRPGPAAEQRLHSRWADSAVGPRGRCCIRRGAARRLLELLKVLRLGRRADAHGGGAADDAAAGRVEASLGAGAGRGAGGGFGGC